MLAITPPILRSWQRCTAAGLDARPYRMSLPATLRWVEVDLPEIIDYKEESLSGEKPRCSLSRVRLDLADREPRRKLFAELGREASNALIVTEGLIVYLEPKQAATLAEDLAAPEGFRRWIIDLMSPGLRRMITRRIGSMLEEARAPLRFSPEEGPNVFAQQGWRPIGVRPFLKWAARKRRVGFGMRLLSMLPASNGRQGPRPWSAACLLGRATEPGITR
jgi:O-methyltransferase involved in polyketide biosynthesis